MFELIRDLWRSWCECWETILRIVCAALFFVLLATRPIPCSELLHLAANPRCLFASCLPKELDDEKNKTEREWTN